MSIDHAPDRPDPSRCTGAGLAALLDLGLSIPEIARYFSVEPAMVRDWLGSLERRMR
jgi:hypothetical protein